MDSITVQRNIIYVLESWISSLKSLACAYLNFARRQKSSCLCYVDVDSADGCASGSQAKKMCMSKGIPALRINMHCPEKEEYEQILKMTEMMTRSIDKFEGFLQKTKREMNSTIDPHAEFLIRLYHKVPAQNKLDCFLLCMNVMTKFQRSTE
ncbi:hypothetical protein TKK_0011406 [Trichogramma kaykai]|uniref:Uncharacterized protein n=1 Tax=Trichogramma kaykai TaxID=54128 RepID=A0ABD2WS45_9HYME